MGNFVSVWAITYYFRYRSTKWESCKGWKVFVAKPEQHPGSKFYPQMTDYQKTQKKDYNMQDFKEEIHRRACKPSTPVVPYADGAARDKATNGWTNYVLNASVLSLPSLIKISYLKLVKVRKLHKYY